MDDDGAPLLEARDLSLEDLWAGLSFVLRPGGMLRIVGANGAGKSSLLAALCGLSAPDGGEVLWRRLDIRAAAEDYYADLIYAGHKNGVKESLTPLENLRFAAAFRGGPAFLSPEDALKKVGLGGARDVCGRLSAGQKRRVALARLALHRASLWFLDEPFAGLDEDGCGMLNEMIAAHLSAGGAVAAAVHHSGGFIGAQTLRLGRG